MNVKISSILDPYSERLRLLECDGFTRVASYLLSQHGIDHKCYTGHCRYQNRQVLHFWIDVDGWTVDYRARMWLGDRTPHGVFRQADYPEVKYDPYQQVELNVSKRIFEILVLEGAR